MTARLRCRDVEAAARELVAGELPASEAAAVDAHAAACTACARTLAHERRLGALLRDLPDAPAADLLPPELPDRAPVRLLRLRAAWTAAGIAAAALVAATLLRAGPGDRALPDVGGLRVVDVQGDASLAFDDGLLGLVAGAEAVASRRLVETR